jgi:mediator of RNA polymerase II transcription subunit 14
VSITCTDQLSPSGGSFELRFSRCQETESEGDDDADAGYNPHSESEPFFRNILRHGHGRLASSLHQLVCLLRDTLPMAAELEALRAEAEREGLHVMIFAKAAGWHRMLLLLPSGTGTARYGIDWRLMSGDRMVVLDASHSLFKVDGQSSRPELTPTEVPTAPSSPSTTKSPSRAPRGRPSSPSKLSSAKGGLAAASSSTSQAAKEERDVSSLSSPDAGGLGLQPIPNFRGIIADALLEVAAESDEVGGNMKMALSIDVGVVCDKDVVRAVGRAIHRRVWKELRG